MIDLPRYRCHKVVQASKIVSVREKRDCSPTMLVLECGVEVPLSSVVDRITEGADIPGSYFVRYEDGFESWSPAAAFEAGYTKIE